MQLRVSRIAFWSLGVLIFAVAAAIPTPVEAQTPFIPYFGKNRVHYTRFDWYIYKTDHFEIFYYPTIEPHLERIASYAENAYQHISSELKHDLPFRVPMVLFKTQSEFQSQNISGGELPEGVLAFAEPERNRMVLPIDEPPDQLYRLITHELTHVFEFDIIPRGIVGASLPLWMDEGLANYMAGYWNVLDLMQVRDAALADMVPKISEFESQPLSGRLPYSMGHAVFEFIETKWGKDGLRQFLFSIRKSVIGGGESAYEEALKVTPEEFDEQFDRYLKERFKAFRDKERPADYGRNLSPNPRHNRSLTTVLAIEASPSGDMYAAVMGNRKDQELDIIIVSAKNGEVIRNLTDGFDKDRGFEYIATAGGLRGNLVPWIAWQASEPGDRVAYFVRTEKDKTLIVQNVIDLRVDYRIPLKAVDGPESPAFSPDGKFVAFSALKDGISDIYTVELATGTIKNLTNDRFADYSPTFAPNGRAVVYTARISSNDKLFQLDLASGQKKQLTFGAHDDTAAKYVDDNIVLFTSTAIPPTPPLPQEVARNANMPNAWTLDLRTGELHQWTDVVTGNISAVPVKGNGPPRIGFVSFYKGEHTVHIISAERPKATVAPGDFGTAAPIIDFTPPMGHQMVPDNVHKKGAWERMSLASRPPVNVGVTSGGDFLGSTELVFTDVLGDKLLAFQFLSVSQYRSFGLSYFNQERRLQYGLQGFWQDSFYYGAAGFSYYAPLLDRDQSESTRTQRGGIASAIWPFNRYTRAELYGGYMFLREQYNNEALQAFANEFQTDAIGNPIFRRGHMAPMGVALVQETTVFREYGPVAGNTYRIAIDVSPPLGDSWLTRTTAQVDARHYQRLGTNGVFATRFKGFRSWGTNPDFMYFGGNSEMRGYEYLEFYGQHAFFANAELRFPIIEAMLTPIGVLGGLRGVFFANMGASGFNGIDYTLMTNNTTEYRPLIGYDVDLFGGTTPIYGLPELVSNFRLVDGRASYGFGLETFILGFPMHFDWSWKTLFNERWEDLLFRSCFPADVINKYVCGPAGPQFRRGKFSFWIGYDF
jgi:hypothetical protein